MKCAGSGMMKKTVITPVRRKSIEKDSESAGDDSMFVHIGFR
jgi:hypothetical protein